MSAPDRIFATVNGSRSVFPSGLSYLTGGWDAVRNKESAVEYVRADVAIAVSDDMARALVAEYRRIWPGAGFPTLEAARDLLVAALAVKP
jgi:hypothetical protein